MSHPVTAPKPTGFGLILLLFVSGRLMMLMAFPLENLVAFGDYRHYFNIAQISSPEGCQIFTGTLQACYPFIHFWYEFPPIFPYLNIAVYWLAGQQFKNYLLILALLLLLAESANLFLLHRLALSLHGPAAALTLAWVYTALFVPIFFWLGNFDALTSFFILLGLYALIKQKNRLLALALGLGAMVKFVPVMVLATVWRVRGWKTALALGGATLLISLLIFGPFALISPRFTLASLQAQAGKSSYQTVWALVDGNLTTGNFGRNIEHFDVAEATQPVNNPSRLSPWLTLIPFGLLGLFILTRPRTLPDPNFEAVLFTALTFIIFFLWSKGWSPQWQTFLIPLLLLALPVGRAVLFIIVLGFINFLEWPVMLSRGMTELLPLTIIARTLVFALLAVELYRLFTSNRERVL